MPTLSLISIIYGTQFARFNNKKAAHPKVNSPKYLSESF
jgi:hypothetical protein